MGSQNNKKINESGSFNVPKNNKREKSTFEEFITKLLGRVILTKKVFFGFDEQKIVVFVTPSLKVASVVTSPKKLKYDFPLKKGDTIQGDDLKFWAEDNEFELTFMAPTPPLKLKLYNMFGEVMVEGKINESVEDNNYMIKKVKESFLPESIKEWIQKNPEKFIESINNIKRLLD